MTEQPPPATVQEYVLDRLRADLLARELLPGNPIRQDALATRYGVSRVPVREALTALQSEGLVEHRPRRGWVVAELSVDDLTEVYALRKLLETEAVRIGVPRLTREATRALKELADAVTGFARVPDVAAMAQANRQFHLTLLGACESPRLMRLITQMWDLSDVYRSLYYTDEANRHLVDDEHQTLLRAVAANDVEAVIAAQDEHRDHAVAALTTAITTSGRAANGDPSARQ